MKERLDDEAVVVDSVIYLFERGFHVVEKSMNIG